jgi:hypothetical protein
MPSVVGRFAVGDAGDPSPAVGRVVSCGEPGLRLGGGRGRGRGARARGSELFVERIAARLGNPVVDPHGDPIPTQDGQLLAAPSELLSGSSRARSAGWCGCGTAIRRFCATLDTCGIDLGDRIEVLGREPFGGSVVIASASQRKDVCTVSATAWPRSSRSSWTSCDDRSPANSCGRRGDPPGTGAAGLRRFLLAIAALLVFIGLGFASPPAISADSAAGWRCV